VERRERERIMNQGAVRAHDPRAREHAQALERGLEGSPVVGRRLRQRLRNFRPSADSYLASLGGPLPYMVRLRDIADQTAAHEERLGRAWAELAAGYDGDVDALAREWRRIADGWRFDEVNGLIEKHNRYFPAESRLPMDPRTGDFVLLNGEPYSKQPLDAAWILERFPAAPG
jgi:hypothetical protein